MIIAATFMFLGMFAFSILWISPEKSIPRNIIFPLICALLNLSLNWLLYRKK